MTQFFRRDLPEYEVERRVSRLEGGRGIESAALFSFPETGMILLSANGQSETIGPYPIRVTGAPAQTIHITAWMQYTATVARPTAATIGVTFELLRARHGSTGAALPNPFTRTFTLTAGATNLAEMVACVDDAPGSGNWDYSLRWTLGFSGAGNSLAMLPTYSLVTMLRVSGGGV